MRTSQCWSSSSKARSSPRAAAFSACSSFLTLESTHEVWGCFMAKISLLLEGAVLNPRRSRCLRRELLSPEDFAPCLGPTLGVRVSTRSLSLLIFYAEKIHSISFSLNVLYRRDLIP